MKPRAAADKKNANENMPANLKEQVALRLNQKGDAHPCVQGGLMREHIKSVFEAYLVESEKIMDTTKVAGQPRKRSKRLRGSDSDSEDDMEDVLQESPTGSWTRGSKGTRGNVSSTLTDQALWWIDLLTAYMGEGLQPHMEHMSYLRLLIRQHEVHSDQRVSHAAFKLLQLCVDRYSSTKLCVYPAGTPYEGVLYVATTDQSFTCLSEFPRPLRERCHKNDHINPVWLPTDFFCHLWQRAKNLSVEGNADEESWVHSHYGDVLLLTVMVQQLEAELAPRLAAYRAAGRKGTLERLEASGPGSQQTKRRNHLAEQRLELLKGSHLWRLLVVKATGPRGETVRRVVRLLLVIIGKGAPGQIANDAPRDGRLITASENLRGTASAMLRLLLRLFGTMEAAGAWKHSMGTCRGDDDINLRTEMDILMVEAMSVATCASLLRPENKQALLAVLQPCDVIRLLGLVIGSTRPENPKSQEVYSSMDAARAPPLTSGVTASFITIDPADVLRYMGDEIVSIQKHRKGECPAEDMAIFAARLASACAAMRSADIGNHLQLYETVCQKMLHRNLTGDQELTAEAVAELRGSHRVLKAAAERAA